MAAIVLRAFLVTFALWSPGLIVHGQQQVNDQSIYFPLLMPEVQPMKVSVTGQL